MIQRSQSRRRNSSQASKKRQEIQLPKINRTLLLLKDKENQSQYPTAGYFSNQVKWVVESVDYLHLNQQQIQEEYKKLRKELNFINLEVAKALSKIDIKTLNVGISNKKGKQSESDLVKVLEIRDREVENNFVIIDRLKKQYGQLQKRVSAISATTKDDISDEILKSKEDIQKNKKKIKQLKMKNKTAGETIVNSDDMYSQIRRLEIEKEAGQKKKDKLQSKTDQVYTQISSIQLKLDEISDNYAIAQNYFEEYDGKVQISEQQKQMDIKMKHAHHCLEVVTKKNQISNNSKQQKYHISLKNLQNQISKVDILEQKTASLDLEIIHCKKIMQQLEEVYKQNERRNLEQNKSVEILKEEPLFFTEFDGGEKQDKSQKNQTFKSKLNERSNTELENVEGKNQKYEIKYQNSQRSEGSGKQISENKIPPKEQILRQRISTSNGLHEDEQQDIICNLDEKFHYKTKGNLKSSKNYQKETQMGDNMAEQYIEEDDQLIEFKTKISQERFKRKSNENFDKGILQDISKIQSQIKSFDIADKDEIYDQDDY